MICYRCGVEAKRLDRCPGCGANLRTFQKVRRMSNAYYNLGLQQASVRNLSGAIESLKQSLKLNKKNIDARNLLGLVYYEMGETVDALSEWVLSQSLKPEDNLANRYLDSLQQNQGLLDTVNQTIKKYNQALHYCQQDSRDLAIIQLKKVLTMNPKLVKAHQLLALLFIQEGKLEQAKKSLRNAGKIDANNTLTLRYLKEVNTRLRENSSTKKRKEDDLISYQSGNETIIMPKRFKESSLGSTILSIIVGILIGTAVTVWLIVPSVKNKANEEAQKKLLEASDAVATNGQIIKELEEDKLALQAQLDEVIQNDAKIEERVKSYEDLLDAYVNYFAGDVVEAGKSLEKVDAANLSKNTKKIYRDLNTEVQEKYLETLYAEGYGYYNTGHHEDAIFCLQKVADEQIDYEAGTCAYYLAQSYRKSGDLAAARTYYQYVIDNYPGTERARTARNYVDAEE